MGHVDFASTDHVISQLSHLLGRDIAHIRVEDRVDDMPATVRIVSLIDSRQIQTRLVIKAQEDQTALCLYTHYLKPFDLTSAYRFSRARPGPFV
jgi:hypothetical protein